MSGLLRSRPSTADAVPGPSRHRAFYVELVERRLTPYCHLAEKAE